MRASAPLPRGPVLDWSSFSGPRTAGLPAVDDLPNRLPTTSGRAALYQALRALGLRAGSRVLVPSYHCPTMVAPVVHAGLVPVFYAIDANTRPQLDTLDFATLQGVGAIIVVHYFGIARSMAAERDWCDAHGIALIEDCAHCFFGQAGERPVGTWGDFAIASITKFLPVAEAGLLASSHRSISLAPLPHQDVRAQVKAWADVLERSTRSHRLHGLSQLLTPLFAWKNGGEATPGPATMANIQPTGDPLQGCDMSRSGKAPAWLAKWLLGWLPRGRIVRRRQTRMALLRHLLADLPGSRLPFSTQAGAGAPYVLPLWVEDADRVYLALRRDGWPVFRWDRRWPSQPVIAGDHGDAFGRHLLQLPCHQDFTDNEIKRLAGAVATQLRQLA